MSEQVLTITAYMGNTPNEWLFVCELFSIFVTSSVVMRSADILKVFSHCLYNEI